MTGKVAVSALPKSDELENLLRFLAFAQIRIGVAEHGAACMLSEKDQHAGLAAATGRDIVPFNQRVFPVEGYGMKIQIEGFSGQEFASLDAVVPSRQEPRRFAVIDSARAFRTIALLGKGIHAGEYARPLIAIQRHTDPYSSHHPQ